MASKYREANGGYVVQFTLGDKRPKVRLGLVSERTVETVQRRIESLLQAHKHGSTLDNVTAEWVAKIDDDLAEKLADLGLIPLCRRCYETPAVRELYPVPDKYAAREPVVAYTGEPTEPTDAAPGTADKVAVMEARAACGQSLFHPLDGPVDTRRTTPAAAAWLAGQLFSEVA